MTATCASAQTRGRASEPPTPGRGEREGNPPQEQGSGNGGEAKPDIRGTTDQPAIVRITKSQIEADQEKSDREAEATNKRWTIWLAGFTALIGAGQIYVIRKQVALAKAQNDIMDTQTTIMSSQLVETQKAAQAALESAHAAKASADTGRLALMVTESADVYMDGMTREPGGPMNGITRLTLTFKNHGRTRGIRVKCAWKFWKGEPTPPIDLTPTVEHSMPAGAESHIGGPKTIGESLGNDTDACIAGTIPWGFVVSTEFWDLFGRYHRRDHVFTYSTVRSPFFQETSVNEVTKDKDGDQ